MKIQQAVILICIIGKLAVCPSEVSGAGIRSVTWNGIDCLLVDAPVDLSTGDFAAFVSLEIGVAITGGVDPFFQTGYFDVAIAACTDAEALQVGRIVGGYILPDDGIVRIDLTPCQSWVGGVVRVVALIGALERNDGTISVALAQDKAAGFNLRIVGATGGTISGSTSGTGDVDAAQQHVERRELVCSPNPARTGVAIEATRPEKYAGGGRVEVFDLRGRLIRTMPFGGAGKAEVWWDGRDARTMPVASGVYFLVAYGSDGLQLGKQKVTLLR